MSRSAFRLRGRLDDPDGKRDLTEELFAEVAPKYDRITRILSFGQDQAWKRQLLEALPAELNAPVCLDLACGTGDLCAGLLERYPDADVTGLDLSAQMLGLARERHGDDLTLWVKGEMTSTGLPDQSVDILTGGYALRNAPDLEAALREVSRLLKPDGIAAFLDFSRSPQPAISSLSVNLLRAWGGIWGLVFHRNPAIYAYLGDSLARFPDRTEVVQCFQSAGLEISQRTPLFGGMLEIVTARPLGLDD